MDATNQNALAQESLRLHEELKGKIEVVSRAQLNTARDLALLYTPGVAEPCKAIAHDYTRSWDLTRKNNLVAVITDGSAVLGLGDIGPAAGMPVMEGKCLLFKEFADIDAIPICIDTHDVDEAVRCIYLISKSFGGINLEDIAAPRCFEIERRLKELCDIPVFHDDQHGTAIVCAAGLTNALKLVHKELPDIHIVMSGAGAAGTAIAELLLAMGAKHILVADRSGILASQRGDLTDAKRELAELTNQSAFSGSLADALVDADVFIGVSGPDVLTQDMVKTMADNAIVFAMANPIPEIMPAEAKAAGAAIVATGRSDFANQINNVLAFPGIFKGALQARTTDITQDMQIAAAHAIAQCVADANLCADYIIPSALDKSVADKVAAAVVSCVAEH